MSLIMHNSLLSEVALIRAVIFDFGRVISAQKPEALFRRYERELGLTPGTINIIMFASDAWRDALLGKKTATEYWESIGPQLGLYSPGQIESFRLRYHADEKINHQVLELIGILRGRYKLAVCSNSPPRLVDWLADWRMEHLFDVIFCSGDEGIMKPDRAAFGVTLTRLGVEPSEAVLVDDDSENIEAASRCGLTAIHFTDGAALKRALSAIIPLPEQGVSSV
jgi:putative hydrolase of the HAD superfamily